MEVIRQALAVAILLAAGPAVAGELRSAGPLGIRAPDGIVLGADTVPIHLSAAAGLHLVTSVGEISALVTEHAEQRAILTLPTEHYPQLAIVAALDDAGVVHDWLAIPLAGRARIKVDTDPRATVVVQIGQATFGPVAADARGGAYVDIVVPPGVHDAKAIVTSVGGGIREKAIALGGHAFSRMLVACSPQGDRVTAISATASGEPDATAPQLSASVGELDDLSARGPGIVEARYRGIPSSERAQITATRPGESMPSTCTLTVPPEPPSELRITAGRTRFVAGSGPIDLEVVLAYPGVRRPLEVASVELSSELGTIDAVHRTTTGWAARWSPPNAFAGKRVADVRARVVTPAGAIVGEASVELAAAAPARIDATVPTGLHADGTASGVIEARVIDAFGNSIAAPQLTAKARGQVGAFTLRADGTEVATYIAPLARSAGDDVIELSDRSTGLAIRVPMTLAALPRRLAVSARVGYLSNLGRIAAPIASVAAALRLPVLDERLIAGVQLAGYATRLDVATADPAEMLAVHLTAVPVLARTSYRVSLGPVDVWAGAGLGPVFASSRVTSASSGTHGTRSTSLAATAFVGAGRRVGPGWLIAEVAYLHASLDHAQVAGRIGGVMATLGFAYEP